MKKFLCLFVIIGITFFKLGAFTFTHNGLRYDVDYTKKTAEVTDVISDIKDIVIPETIIASNPPFHPEPIEAHVTAINFSSSINIPFKKNIETIKAPSVTSVAGLNECIKLKTVDTPKATKYSSCAGCVELVSISYSDDIESFGSFSGCKKLFVGGFKVPAKIKFIHIEQFKDCASLAWIDMSNCNISVIPKGCFQGSGIKSVKFPAGLQTIQKNAFAECQSLNHSVLILPESVTTVHDAAFKNCISLTSIKMQNAVPYYSWTSTEPIEGVFKGCINLTGIILSPKTTIIPPSMFEGCIKLKNITLPDAVNKIYKRAFYGCSSLKGDKKRPFKLSADLDYIGVQAFSNCASIEWVDYVKADNRVITIEEYGFKDCIKLKHFTVRTKTGIRPMNKKGLVSDRTTADSGLKIGRGAFLNCPELQFIPEGSNITNVNELYSIFGSYNLAKTLYIPGNNSPINSEYIEMQLLEGQECSQIEKIYFAPNFSSLAGGACATLNNLERVTFLASDEIESDEEFVAPIIENDAFDNCNSITSVESFWTKPPMMESYAFTDNVFNTANLTVPFGFEDTYSSSEGWSKFTSLSTNGINDINSSAFDNSSFKCYTIEGIPCSIDSKGIVIIIDSRGNCKKIFNRN